MSQTAQPLSGQRVLVTRPAHQADLLCQQLQNLGAEPIRFPTLEIVPTAEDSSLYPDLKNQFLQLDRYHHVIFISANAARLAYEWIDTYWPQLPVGINWLAVGSATARTLNTLGIDAQSADQMMDSEALLALPELQNPVNERILICRGSEGRELLADTLLSRGAQVDYAELYRRCCPGYGDQGIESIIYKNLPSAMLVTSAEALDNLINLSQGRNISFPWQKLCAITLVVPSQRVAERASERGFNRIRVAQNATDAAMIAALTQPDSTDQ